MYISIQNFLLIGYSHASIMHGKAPFSSFYFEKFQIEQFQE